jgi:hypothetical protein
MVHKRFPLLHFCIAFIPCRHGRHKSMTRKLEPNTFEHSQGFF